MPTWNEQLTRYFLQPADLAAGRQMPHTSEGNLVRHHIDGYNYFGALKVEIDFLLAIARNDLLNGTDSGCFFYIIGWGLGLVDAPRQSVMPGEGLSPWGLVVPGDGPALRLDDGSIPAPTTSGEPDLRPLMIDKLAEMHDAGVDVRVLGWVSPLVVNFEPVATNTEVQNHAFVVNIHTLRSVQELRRRLGPGSATLLTLGHPFGAMHLKTIVAGTANGMRAYVGGIDLRQIVATGVDHLASPWHDAAVEIAGPAAEAIYAFYRDLWNEQIDRRPDRFRLSSTEVIPSHFTPQSPSVDPPAITAPVSEFHVTPASTPGNHVVQVLRTTPGMSFLLSGPASAGIDFIERVFILGSGRSPLSFAPNGIFEFSSALQHAIGAAEKYIYIEDQAFWGIEVMGWINARLKAVPGLKVILVWGADPRDPATPFLHQAINNTLIVGVSDAADRIRFFTRSRITVHSKITIIDDVWAAVGSANCTRRSHYTDGELSVSVMEDSPTPFAKVLRKDLWGELCGLPAGSARDPLLDLELSLAVIEPTWSAATPPDGLSLMTNMVRKRLPFVYFPIPVPDEWPGVEAPVFDPLQYDVLDADSR